MAIALDATSASGVVGPASSATLAHTCSGSNRILFVGFFADATDTITSVTYAGVSMTVIDKTLIYLNRYIYLYYLIAPATGINNIVVLSSNSSCYFGVTGASYTGANQSGVPDAHHTVNNGSVTATSSTNTLTSIANNCWMVLAGRATVSATLVAGTGATSRAEVLGNGQGLFDSNGVITPAGSDSMTFSWDGTNQNNGSIMASFAPYTIVTKLLTETITHTDLFQGALFFYLKLTEAITHTDTMLRNFFMTIKETIAHADSILKTISLKFQEVIAHLDIFGSIFNIYKILTETITHTDFFSNVLTIFKTFTESITHTDVFKGTLVFIKNLTETITHSDVFIGALTFIKKLTETIQHIDHLFLNGLLSIWTKRIKPTLTSWTGRTKPITNWVRRTKP